MTDGVITAKVFRFNPDTDLYPTYQTYEVPAEERMMVLQVLKQIYEKQDRTLAFRYFSCGFKLCRSCMMTINGVPKHACMTVVKPGDSVTVEPFIGYPIIRDLVVDFERKVETPNGTFQIQAKGGPVIKKVAEK
jgi:succinate dehydrogenase/fumarate reductase iron-sulfur protein